MAGTRWGLWLVASMLVAACGGADGVVAADGDGPGGGGVGYDGAVGDGATGRGQAGAGTGPACGDGVCDPLETCASCGADCGPCAPCGDGDCVPGETCASCPGDCGACAAGCGDGVCGELESCGKCPLDCGACCGDGLCVEGDGESCASCPADCLCKPGELCAGAECCLPTCEGVVCGGDGCGGTCGSCSEGATCIGGACILDGCAPACEVKVCGGDGCGGTCGSCEAGDTCVDGACVPTACTPDCAGRECGADGCGGSCGACDGGGACEDGLCGCVPQCAGKQCGADGCGGVCGQCAAPESCGADGTCACVPPCGEAPAGPTCDGTAKTGAYCGGDKVSGGSPDTLYACSGPGPATVVQVCADGCVVAPPGTDDSCSAPGPTCSATAKTGAYCAGDKVDYGVPDTLYKCNGPGPAIVVQVCANGCTIAPAGTDDFCKAAGAKCSSTAKTGYYCAGDKVDGGTPGTLYLCDGPGPAKVDEVCKDGCVVAPAGEDDTCKAAAPTCTSTAKTGYYCGGDKVDNGSKNTLYKCNGPGKATAIQSCASSCVVAPAGQDDYCGGGGGGSGTKLPFTCGSTYTCSNGNFTSSHTGKDAYAYDFAMPVGTKVRAMRGGSVLRVRKVSSPGSACYNGGGSSCANLANTVEVLHADGTVGLYMHLSTISVSKGQGVSQGQVLAKSGNSGYSTGPHLHVQIQGNCGIWWCQSKPFSFAEASSLYAGKSVKSQNCP